MVRIYPLHPEAVTDWQLGLSRPLPKLSHSQSDCSLNKAAVPQQFSQKKEAHSAKRIEEGYNTYTQLMFMVES